jgi:hypothetical protein
VHSGDEAMVDAAGLSSDTHGVSAAPVSTEGCLCGAVTYLVTGGLPDVINCYCERCRRFTGHYTAATAAHFAAVDLAPRGRCEVRVLPIMWSVPVHRATIWICAGSVEPPTGLSTAEAWWSSRASDYFTRPDVPERFTE